MIADIDTVPEERCCIQLHITANYAQLWPSLLTASIGPDKIGGPWQQSGRYNAMARASFNSCPVHSLVKQTRGARLCGFHFKPA